MVFLGDLEEQAIREVCMGAAEAAAEHKHFAFEPRSVGQQGNYSFNLADLNNADCLMLTGRAYEVVFGLGKRIRTPHVFYLLGEPPTSAPAVGIDDFAVGRMGAEHLIERGYANLACIAPKGGPWASERAEGFAQTCRDRGIKCSNHILPEEALPIYWRTTFSRGDSQLHDLLRSLPKPCGIFAVNDVVACFVIESARSLSFNVPYEVGVLGVDDDPIPNAAAGLSISSVQLPCREIGRQAGMILDLLTQKKPVPRRVVLSPVRVAARASTNAFMVADELVRNAQAYIEENRHRSLRVVEVIRHTRTTAVTLGKRFRRVLNVFPSKYILIRRIEYAKELLREGKLNISEVSQECGFHSCSYFCHMFKRVTKTTPTEMRQVRHR
jgi:LacI family transcriptional regulator